MKFNSSQLSIICNSHISFKIKIINYNSGKKENKTEKEDMASTRFHGPATSCEELLKIGYTRNGFYLVKGKNATSNSHVEMVDCLFRNPNGAKEGRKFMKTNYPRPINYLYCGINS